MAINGNINKLFVPYEIALKLKEKGFDEPCMSYYFPDGGFMEAAEEDDTRFPGDLRFYEYSNSEGENIAAPLYQQAIDFVNSKGFSLKYGNISLSLLDKQIEECLNKLESIK